MINPNQFIPNEDDSYNDNQENPQQFSLPPSPIQRAAMSEATFLQATDPKSAIIELEKYYRGEYYDVKEKRFKTDDRFRMMNEEGIRSIMSDLSGIVFNGTSVTYIDKEEKIYKLCSLLGKTITIKIAINYRQFGIQKCNARTIVMASVNMAFITLHRSLQARTLTAMGTMRNEIINTSQLKQDKKGFSWFKW